MNKLCFSTIKYNKNIIFVRRRNKKFTQTFEDYEDSTYRIWKDG